MSGNVFAGGRRTGGGISSVISRGVVETCRPSRSISGVCFHAFDRSGLVISCNDGIRSCNKAFLSSSSWISSSSQNVPSREPSLLGEIGRQFGCILAKILSVLYVTSVRCSCVFSASMACCKVDGPGSFIAPLANRAVGTASADGFETDGSSATSIFTWTFGRSLSLFSWLSIIKIYRTIHTKATKINETNRR